MVFCQGPPLNDSRANRAMSARAIDRRLELKIVPSQPWVGARLSGLESAVTGADPLLVSEIRRCTLHVTNHGLVPLRSLLIKPHSSSMWVCLGGDDGTPLGNSHGSLVGLDGSLMRVPLPDVGLAAGSTVDMPLYIRPGRDGVQQLALYFQYGREPPAPRVQSRVMKWLARVREHRRFLGACVRVRCYLQTDRARVSTSRGHLV